MNDFGLYLVMTNPKVGYVACAEAAVATRLAQRPVIRMVRVFFMAFLLWFWAALAPSIYKNATPGDNPQFSANVLL